MFSVEPYVLAMQYTVFDVSPDDQRFLMVCRLGSDSEGETALILVENWLEELKAKVGND